MTDYLRIGQTAKLLGVSTKTLQRWDKKGVFKPSLKLKSGHRLYAKHDILAYKNMLKNM